jgi:hypothetical protein
MNSAQEAMWVQLFVRRKDCVLVASSLMPQRKTFRGWEVLIDLYDHYVIDHRLSHTKNNCED